MTKRSPIQPDVQTRDRDRESSAWLRVVESKRRTFPMRFGGAAQGCFTLSPPITGSSCRDHQWSRHELYAGNIPEGRAKCQSPAASHRPSKIRLQVPGEISARGTSRHGVGIRHPRGILESAKCAPYLRRRSRAASCCVVVGVLCVTVAMAWRVERPAWIPREGCRCFGKFVGRSHRRKAFIKNNKYILHKTPQLKSSSRLCSLPARCIDASCTPPKPQGV